MKLLQRLWGTRWQVCGSEVTTRIWLYLLHLQEVLLYSHNGSYGLSVHFPFRGCGSTRKHFRWRSFQRHISLWTPRGGICRTARTRTTARLWQAHTHQPDWRRCLCPSDLGAEEALLLQRHEQETTHFQLLAFQGSRSGVSSPRCASTRRMRNVLSQLPVYCTTWALVYRRLRWILHIQIKHDVAKTFKTSLKNALV